MFGEIKVDDNFKKALVDYFDSWDLVDLLELNTEDIVDAFEDVIEERLDEMKEYIGYNPNEEEEVSEGE